MPYCPNCKVELGPQSGHCPLCGALPVNKIEEQPPQPDTLHSQVPFPAQVHDADARERLSGAEMRMMTVELISVSIGIALAVTIFIDIIFFHSLTWSRYTSVALAAAWITIAIPLVLWKHPWLTFALLGPSALGAVFLWFTFAGALRYFLMPAMPLTLLVIASAAATGALIGAQRRKGLNTVGIALAASGVLCAGIETILSLFLLHRIALYWSVIVLLSVIPVALLFFYLHYRITNRASLKKLLRI